MAKKGITPYIAKQIRAEKGIKETKLQRLRVKKGLSQLELSNISGVSKRTIQYYEQQKTQIDGARLNTLCKLSVALDCKIEDIIEDTNLIDKFRMVK